MSRLNTLKRQHREIIDLIQSLRDEIAKDKNKDWDYRLLAKKINNLSGYLKIHLVNEDKHLYPRLLESGNKALEEKTRRYIDEMGSLNSTFNEFKGKFNIASKIKNFGEDFESETLLILKKIEERIKHEDKDLYVGLENII